MRGQGTSRRRRRTASCRACGTTTAEARTSVRKSAITRFLADKLGLAGSDAAERAAVDAMYCFWFSTLRNNGVSHDGEHYSVAALKEADEGLTAAKVPPYEDVFRLDPLSRAERSLVALKRFEEVLGASKSGYLVGDQITYPDHGLFYILYELAEDDNVPDFAERFALPHCGAFLDRMSRAAATRRLPRVAAAHAPVRARPVREQHVPVRRWARVARDGGRNLWAHC